MVVFSLLYYFIGLCDPAVPLGSLGLVKEKRMNHESAGESSDCRDSKQDRNPIFSVRVQLSLCDMHYIPW